MREIKRDDMRMQQTSFSWPWAMRVWHAWRCAKYAVSALCAENVRATCECVYTSSRTQSSCFNVSVKLYYKKKIITPWPSWENTLSLPSRSFWSFPPGLDPLVLLSTNCQMYEVMLLGFPRLALLVILDDDFLWNFESEFQFTAKYHFQLCESVYTSCYISWNIM